MRAAEKPVPELSEPRKERGDAGDLLRAIQQVARQVSEQPRTPFPDP
jgi:hypothetical protein